jgi:hypothetical protein
MKPDPLDASLNLTEEAARIAELEGTRRKRIAVVAVVVILMTVVGGVVAWKLTRRAMRNVVTGFTTAKEETVDIGAIVTQVRELSRLETASMRVMHISTTTQQYEMVPNALAGDEVQFLAQGDVIAGVDLSMLKGSDAWRDPDGTIVMRLPPPQILVTRIDNRESKIISRKTGLLRRADVNLESRVRQTAEQGIRNEAVKNGILPMASRNAEAKLAQFLQTVGAKRVRFVSAGTQVPPPQL